MRPPGDVRDTELISCPVPYAKDKQHALFARHFLPRKKGFLLSFFIDFSFSRNAHHQQDRNNQETKHHFCTETNPKKQTLRLPADDTHASFAHFSLPFLYFSLELASKILAGWLAACLRVVMALQFHFYALHHRVKKRHFLLSLVRGIFRPQV